ncbi:MAG: hypothetical protein AB1461_18960 [Thermodesulfobacteriota bacterium]
MKKERITTIAMYVVFFGALLGFFALPKPYSVYAHRLWVASWALLGGYGGSLKSRKSKTELFRNVVIYAVGIAALGMMFYGEPSYDEDGYPVSEGFDVTWEQRCAMGVRLFLELIAGGVVGVQIAFMVKSTGEGRGTVLT